MNLTHTSELGVVEVKRFENPGVAPHYSKNDGFKMARLTNIAVVDKGTARENATVDLVFEDEKGQKFVAMAMGSLIHSVNLLVGEIK